jgi:hypothetical protein
MTEFDQALLPLLPQSALPITIAAAPVANEREAFCAKGCHSSFYRKRCVVCDAA